MHTNKEANFEKVKVILLDVAGTTTSLQFIKEKLFAFINEGAAAFLKKNSEDATVKKALDGIKENEKELDTESAAELIIKLTQENSENASLKTLQGLISKEGYENGTLKAHIYEDVRSAFETWSVDKKIAIYSTGDKESQKLLFEHTTEGNLSSHISNYFDQSTGSKREPESYVKLLEELNVSSDEVIFINDDLEELNAAKKSGLLTALITRKEKADVDADGSKEFSTTISSFADLSFEVSNKRKIDETTHGTEVPPSKIPKTAIANEPEAAVTEPEKTAETTYSTDSVQEKPLETPSENEAMDVDDSEKEKPVEAETKFSMEIEEIKPELAKEEASTTESQKTDEGETSEKVEESKTEVDAIEEKPIETDTKTENSESTDKVDIANDKEDVATNKMDEDNAKEKESSEVTSKADKETEKKEINVDDCVETKSKITETDSAEVTTTNSTDDEKCSNEKPAEVTAEPSNANHVKSDAKEEVLNKVRDEPSVDKSEKVDETKAQQVHSGSIVEKPLDKIVSEEKVEETSKDDTNKSDNTNTLSTGDDSNTVAGDKNGVSETHKNGSTNTDKTEETKSDDDVSNGVANGQENGDKSSNAKEAEEETEIKVKKIETNEGSPAVAVEV